MRTKPPFDSLPLRKDGPHGNAWGLFGENDQLGMLNLLTPETTADAAKEIVDGIRISTDLPINRSLKPFWGRQAGHQTIKKWDSALIHDDVITFNTQSSTQWDGFRHFGYQAEKLFFNGKTREDFGQSNVNGTHVWVEAGGIVGRGVLLDYASFADSKGIEISPFTPTSVTVNDLKEVAASQGTTLKNGDILIIRFGWTHAVNQLPESEWNKMADDPNPSCIGLEQSEEMLRWLWDSNFAAAASDGIGLETWPCQNLKYFFHEWLLAGWGFPIGEVFDLEKLSEECKKKGRWSFFFSSVPLKVEGGVATPSNGVAIL